MFRSGTVALVGRANVGKSTFLNTALGEPLSIVSSCPQTTRDALLGVVHRDYAEFAVLDSPGLHKPHNELGRRMNLAAREATRQANYALILIDTQAIFNGRHAPTSASRGPSIDAEDARIIADLPSDIPWSIVLNKVDRLRDKAQLLPLLSQLSQQYPNRAVIPVCSMKSEDVERVLREIAPSLPEGPARYEPDALTDRPIRYFAAEYIREQIMRTTHGELPFAVAVTIDEFDESANGAIIKATISVEKDGQRIILIGHKGQQIKEIGILARQRIEQLLQKKLHLQLFVRTCKRWKDNQTLLTEFGYASAAQTKGTGRA